MEDVATHGLEQRPGLLQGFGVAADHEGQGAGCRAGSAAGHRRVEHRQAALAGGGVDLARRGRGDGRAFQHQGAGGDVREQAIVVEVQAFDVLAGRQHADDHVGALHRVAGAAGGAGAGGDQAVDGALHQVEDVQQVAGLEQVGGHRRAHVAEADEGDLFHGAPPVAAARPLGDAVKQLRRYGRGGPAPSFGRGRRGGSEPRQRMLALPGRLEVRLDHRLRDRFHLRPMPVRCVVAIDQPCAYPSAKSGWRVQFRLMAYSRRNTSASDR